MRIACAVLVVALIGARPLQAARRPANTPERVRALVRKHLRAARSHFDLGEYDQAATEWRRAYRLKAIPVLLFDMAQAYRLGGRYSEARDLYRSYLNAYPKAPNKAEVQSRIRTMTRYMHHPPEGAAH